MPLPLILGLVSLAAAVFADAVTASPRSFGPCIVRRVWRSTGADLWEASELLSEGAHRYVGDLFGVDVVSWWPGVKSGMYRTFVLANIGASNPDQHVVFRTLKVPGGWDVEVSFSRKYGMTSDVQKEYLRQVCAMLGMQDQYAPFQVGAMVDGVYLARESSTGLLVGEVTDLATLKALAIPVPASGDRVYIVSSRGRLLGGGQPLAIFTVSNSTTGPVVSKSNVLVAASSPTSKVVQSTIDETISALATGRMVPLPSVEWSSQPAPVQPGEIFEPAPERERELIPAIPETEDEEELRILPLE